VEYLGHIVSHEGVKVDTSKIKSIKEWKIPTSIKHMQGFLRLTRYCLVNLVLSKLLS